MMPEPTITITWGYYPDEKYWDVCVHTIRSSGCYSLDEQIWNSKNHNPIVVLTRVIRKLKRKVEDKESRQTRSQLPQQFGLFQ